MTKSELIEKVFEVVGTLSKKDTQYVVNTIFDGLVEALKRDEKIEIRGFGSFRVKERGSRIGRNPRSGDEVMIETKKRPFFRPGKELRERVNGWER